MREFIQINRGWYFTGPDGLGTAVDLPHTWNAVDGQDGGNDYWRGTCLYEKDFTKPQYAADERIYLEFRGVNASAKAELNGELIGTHDGGYSTFRWDITDFLADENHLKVWTEKKPTVLRPDLACGILPLIQRTNSTSTAKDTRSTAYPATRTARASATR